MSEIRNAQAGTCCLCFCAWGHTSQYCTPVCLPKSAIEMILFSSARCLLSPPCFVVGMYFTLLSCRDLDGCPFFWKEISSAKPFKLLQNAFTWPPVSQGGSLLWPMWLWRIIDREGLSVRYFKHVLCFATLFFIIDVPCMQMPPCHRTLCPD